MNVYRWILVGLGSVFAGASGVDSCADTLPGVVLEEFVFESAPFPSCHAATLVELADGTLVSAFFGGTAERNPDVEIWVSRKAPGEVWSAPVSVADGVQLDGSRLPTWNPVLFQTAADALTLYYKIGPSPSTWWGMEKVSHDHGMTWGSARKMGDGLIGPVKNKPILVALEILLAGSSTEHDGWNVHLERSVDNGKSWIILKPQGSTDAIGAIQPSLLAYADGRIQMLCRTRSEHEFVAQSWSMDRGMTWSPLSRTNLPNNNSGLDAVMLRDGRALLVYNHSTRNQSGMGHKGRGVLNVALSRNGQDWDAALVLDHLDEAGKQFSYPAVIQSRDGLVHVLYTWHRLRIKHVVLNPDELVLTPMPDGVWPETGSSSLAAFHRSKDQR